MNTFLCLIVERETNVELAEFQVKAQYLQGAKYKAQDMFKEEQKYKPRLRKYDNNWLIDAVEL